VNKFFPAGMPVWFAKKNLQDFVINILLKLVIIIICIGFFKIQQICGSLTQLIEGIVRNVKL